ncbi:hypothetical protein MHYP_G00137050 [Metynnis hypsauchen]
MGSTADDNAGSPYLASRDLPCVVVVLSRLTQSYSDSLHATRQFGSSAAPPMPPVPCTPTPRRVGMSSVTVLFVYALVPRGGLMTPAHDD